MTVSTSVCAGLACVSLCLFMVAASHGQQEIWSFPGSSKYDAMGHVVAAVGDVDGDGIVDVATHAPGYDQPPFGPVGVGQAVLLSGASGQLLQSWTGTSKYDGTLNRVARVGDVDGDGHPDVAVGMPFLSDTASASPFMGAVRIYSGLTGSLINEIRGDASIDRFGVSLDGVGDVNADGALDLIIGATNATNPSLSVATGKAEVFSGFDGALLYAFFGTSVADQFGGPARAAGDVDADGFDDLLIGARQGDSLGPYYAGGPGYVVIHSAADGQLVRKHTGKAIGDGFGSALDGLGDIDGDGFADYAIGAPSDKGAHPAGIATVYSGGSGAVMYSLKGGTKDEMYLGGQIAGVGDFNADGVPDFTIGNRWLDVDGELFTGTHVYSGQSGRPLTTLFASEFPAYAKSCDGVGDIDGDGFADVALGDGQASPAGITGAGQVSMRGGDDLFLSSLPFLLDFGDTVRFSVRGGPAFAPLAVALVDVGGLPTFQIVFTGVLDSFGEWSQQLQVPSGLGGTVISLRAYALSGSSLLDSSDTVVTFR